MATRARGSDQYPVDVCRRNSCFEKMVAVHGGGVSQYSMYDLNGNHTDDSDRKIFPAGSDKNERPSQWTVG
jgi:hypothetical protein